MERAVPLFAVMPAEAGIQFKRCKNPAVLLSAPRHSILRYDVLSTLSRVVIVPRHDFKPGAATSLPAFHGFDPFRISCPPLARTLQTLARRGHCLRFSECFGVFKVELASEYSIGICR